MGKPQQPELGRSGHTPVVEGQHAKEVIQGEEQPGDGGPTGPVPEDWSCPAFVDTLAVRRVLVMDAGARSRRV